MVVLPDTQIGDIRLIIDLDQNIRVALADQPVGYGVASAENGAFVG